MPDRSGRARPHVLIVEDEVFVGLELSEILRDAGYEPVGPASDVASAQTLLKRSLPDFAVLDVNLEGRTSAPIALTLKQQGIPFLYRSGYTADYVREHLPAAEILLKPVAPTLLIAAIRSALDAARRG